MNSQPFPIYFEFAYFDILYRDLKPGSGWPTPADKLLPDDTLSLGNVTGATALIHRGLSESLYEYDKPPMPAYGVQRHRLTIRESLYARTDWSRVTVGYSWSSVTRNRWNKLYEWGSRHVSGWVESGIDLPVPEKNTGVVEVALPAP